MPVRWGAAVKDNAQVGRLALDGEWALSDETGSHHATMVIPGDGFSALVEAGILPEPYYGRNEQACRWVADRDWTIRRTVSLDETDCSLVVDGLDTVAEVRVNGIEVLRAANAFRTWRVDLSGVARRGENEIEIVFRSATRAADAAQAAQSFPIPYNTFNSPIANGNMLRKPQCDFGWDWNIALAPFGITGGLHVEQNAPRIEGVVVAQDHAAGTLTVTVLAAGGDGEAVSVDCAGSSGSATVENGRVEIELDLGDADLWWPAGEGAQTLHDLTVTFAGAVETRRIGLRTVELLAGGDDGAFSIRVNGRDVFCRGANWIPADALAGRISRESVADLLRSAVAANMNMIRVWGGGRYEPDWFYDLCDELGLMVWQDFMFACNLYPATPEFLDEVEAEVHENVLRLNHHPCIALWCGDNEVAGALSWYEESRRDRDRYLVAYDRLNRTVEKALKSVLPQANWWPSSPSQGPMRFGDAWHDDSRGDMHFWSVWHEGEDFQHYRDISPRFCSEFGFQSYPSMDVVRRFTEPSDWNIASPVLESHQKNAGGNARIAETMFRYFRFPTNFESFLYLSQVQQALAIQTAVDHWRSLKPHCMGTLYWQLNDTWPCASWSSLEYGGGWKVLHHLARRFYAPLRVTVAPVGEEFVFRSVNDGTEPEPTVLEVFAVDPAGSRRRLAKSHGHVPTGRAIELVRVPASIVRDAEMLFYRWSGSSGSGGEEHFAPRPYKAYDLQHPGIRSEVTPAEGGYDIVLTAEALALFVTIEGAGRALSDNCVTLLPGIARRLHLRTDHAAPAVEIRDLHWATYNQDR